MPSRFFRCTGGVLSQLRRPARHGRRHAPQPGRYLRRTLCTGLRTRVRRNLYLCLSSVGFHADERDRSQGRNAPFMRMNTPSNSLEAHGPIRRCGNPGNGSTT